jgi:hypothetical protein
MIPLSPCSARGGEMVDEGVEKLLRGGVHTAVLRVQAEVCFLLEAALSLRLKRSSDLNTFAGTSIVRESFHGIRLKISLL